MAKVAFIQEELRDRIGIMILSAMLKKSGHNPKVFIDSQTDDLEKDISEFDPDMLALSTSTAGIRFACDVIKRFNKPDRRYIIAMGGPHATFYPNIIETDGLDVICRGEGEYAIVELADALDNGNDYSNILNLWVKKEDGIIKNDVRPFVNLNELPMPDREIYYDHYPVLRNKPTKLFLLVRGCPYGCTFCWNLNYRKIYKGKGKYIRNVPIDMIIDEIKYVKETYGLKWVQFISDTINLDREWFMEFLNEYKTHIDMPFLCNVRANLVDEEMVKLMKEAKCDRIDFGIESGDEYLRNTIINKSLSDEEIINAGRWINKYGIRLQTTNIIGLPHETLDTIKKTIEINRKINPEMAKCFILQPYRGTEIYEYAKKMNMIDDTYNYISGTGFQIDWDGTENTIPLKLPNQKEMVNLSHLFDFIVHHKKLDSLMWKLIKLPSNRLFLLIYEYPMVKQDIKYNESIMSKIKTFMKWIKVLVK